VLLRIAHPDICLKLKNEAPDKGPARGSDCPLLMDEKQMKTPPLPPDEESRLRVLEELGILDSEPDDWLDLITAYCCSRFRVPICLVSLVDEDRQWFMSSSGLAAKETPRSVSFCGHAVADNKTLVVADASADSRFSDNPLVMNDPNIRFYAGNPIRVKGQPIGTLCIIDQGVRGLSGDDAAELSEIADAVSWYLANRERAPGRGPASDGERASHPDAAADPPATRDGNQSDPWQEAVDYISARRNTVEARMLASVAFGQGSGGEKEVLTWEEKVLDPRAVSIARRLMALRSKKLSENGGMRDLPHRGSKIELGAGETQED